MSKLLVGDLETSGLDPKTDCILEMALAVVDARTLEIEDVEKWLVLPPNVDGPRSFDAWVKDLERGNSYVFDMHTKNGLLEELRNAATITGAAPRSDGRGPFVEHVEQEALQFLVKNCTALQAVRENRREAAPGETLFGDSIDDLPKGRDSSFMFTGNSIANLDIPMLKTWMPRFAEALHYRIMDVSVLRTWLCDISGVDFPEEIANAIRTGNPVRSSSDDTPAEEAHRAYGDVKACISQLQAMTAWLRKESLDASSHRMSAATRAAGHA